MAGFRDRFIRLTAPVARRGGETLVRRFRPNLILPVYHTVSDEPLPHIRHLYPVKTVAEFTRDLEFLLRHFQPISVHDLMDSVRSGQTFRKPAFLLSFDDGLREFHDLIAPILRARGVPAINFLNPDFLDNRDLFFRYRVSLLIGHLENQPERIGTAKALIPAGRNGSPTDDWKTALLGLGYGDRQLLDEMARRTGLDVTHYLSTHRPYLGSEEVRSLIGQGFHFGSHSLDHPEYRFLPPGEQLRQTRESTQQVVDRFDLGYRAFAFPFTDFGVSRAFFEHLYGEPGQMDLSFGSAGHKQDPCPRHFQRIPMEMGRLSAREVLSGELLYLPVKYLFGRTTIQRL